jgi:hypothetical protein
MKKIENENYLCGKTYTDKENGNCVKNSYPSSGNQGGSYITSGGFGTSGNSYNSQEQHIQQICTYLGGNVLGGAYHDQRKNRDSNDGINYQVKGIVSQLNYYGFKDPKGIVLSDCALEDKDTYTLHQAIQYQPLNLTVLDLSNNYLGLNSVHTIFYGFKGHQIKSINLTNNRLGDDSALFISQALEYGNIPALKYIDVSGNQITATGEGYFAQALESVKVTSISIVLTAKTSLKELLNFFKTGFNYYAKEFHIEQIAMDIESQKYLTNCQKTGVNLAEGFMGGVVKCKHIPNKKIAFFCFINEVLDSIVQPETLNCLIDSHKFFEHEISSLTGASSDQDIHHQECNIF